MKPYTLCVIDMQPTFQAAGSANALVGVTKEILAAKQQNASIILVEYADHGPTYKPLKDLLVGYSNRFRVTKSGDDGSEEIARLIRRRNLSQERLRICGVNTDCCVAATVDGLIHLFRQASIEVVKDACATYRGNSFDWRSYMRHRRLQLVGSN